MDPTRRNFDNINQSLQALGGNVVDPSNNRPGVNVPAARSPKQNSIVKLVARVFPKIASKFENYNVTVVRDGFAVHGSQIKEEIANIKQNLDKIQSEIVITKNTIKSLDNHIKAELEHNPDADVTALSKQRTEAFQSLTNMKTKWSEAKTKIADSLKASDLPFLKGTSVLVQLDRTEKKLDAQFQKAFPAETGDSDWYKLQSYQEQIKGLLRAIETLKTLDFTGLSVSSDKEIKAKEDKIRDLFGKCFEINNPGDGKEVHPKTAAKYSEIYELVPEKYQQKA